MTSALSSHSNLARCSVDETVNLPEAFDARTQWSKCILPVPNQQSKLI